MFKTLSGMGEPAFWSEQVLIFTEHKYWFHQRGKRRKPCDESEVEPQLEGIGSGIWLLSSLFSLPIAHHFCDSATAQNSESSISFGKTFFFFPAWSGLKAELKGIKLNMVFVSARHSFCLFAVLALHLAHLAPRLYHNHQASGNTHPVLCAGNVQG